MEIKQIILKCSVFFIIMTIALSANAQTDTTTTLPEYSTKADSIISILPDSLRKAPEYYTIKYDTLAQDSSLKKLIYRKLAERSVTLLKNRNNYIPLSRLDTLRPLSIAVGSDSITSFQYRLSCYTQMTNRAMSYKQFAQRAGKRIEKIDFSPNVLIIGFYNTVFTESRKKDIAKRLDNLSANYSVITVYFNKGEILENNRMFDAPESILLTYKQTPLLESYAAQAIFGGIKIRGRLPYKISHKLPENYGIESQAPVRFEYTIPEEENMMPDTLKRADTIARTGIKSGAYPGCQLLVAKNRKVIFHKAYGYYTYDSIRRVNRNNMYDLASVTKVSGPLPALMYLRDKGNFKLDVPFSRYWEDFEGTSKSDIKVRDILAHQGRLKSWIPFWKDAVRDNGSFRWFTLKRDSSFFYPVKVSSDLYQFRWYRWRIYRSIRKSELLPDKKYRYSGLAFYLYPEIISNITDADYEPWLKKHFYHKLGAYTITYNPWRFYPKQRMIPTERDTFFRNELLQGYVHDEGAAMMGGVSGNAGLFSTANDLAKLIQMYLHKGKYGGYRYISDSTMQEFTTRQFPENDNRRALGFDKPFLADTLEGHTAPQASEKSFGHSGFTGTFVWADPKYDLVFIFLSNRVYPRRSRGKIYELDIRPRLQEVFYDAAGIQVHDNSE